MKTRYLIATVCVIMSLLSCSKERISGSGQVITETRSVNNFQKVSASGSTEVHITQGAAFKVEVKGFGNLLPYYETRLVSNTLVVGYKNNTNVRNDNVEVFVTMPALTGVETFGSGDIDVSGDFSGNNDFYAAISGSGNISIQQGSAQRFSASISGSGNIRAFDFSADDAETHTSGSGDIEITALSNLNVTIEGSGKVFYKGSPKITSKIYGSGEVIRK